MGRTLDTIRTRLQHGRDARRFPLGFRIRLGPRFRFPEGLPPSPLGFRYPRPALFRPWPGTAPPVEPTASLARLDLHPALATGPRFRSANRPRASWHGPPVVIEAARLHFGAMAPALALRLATQDCERPGSPGA